MRNLWGQEGFNNQMGRRNIYLGQRNITEDEENRLRLRFWSQFFSVLHMTYGSSQFHSSLWEIKLSTSAGSSKKQESSRKNIYFCFIDYAKAFDCVDHNKLWKILKEMGIPDHLIFLLRNLYVGQEETWTWTWNNRLVPNRKRSTARLCIITLLI